MGIETLPTPKERLPGPYPAKRPCENCGAFLRTCNPGPLCDPCGGPGVEQPHPVQIARIGMERDLEGLGEAA